MIERVEKNVEGRGFELLTNSATETTTNFARNREDRVKRVKTTKQMNGRIRCT